MSAHPSSPVPAPRRTSLAGPVTLTVTGVVLLLVALVLAVVAAAGFVGAVRSDVLTRDGRPGSAVLVSADAPGATSVELTAGERYAVYLVVPRDAVRDDERPDLDEDVLLLAPSGAVIEADDSPGVNMESGVGGLVAVTVGAFTAPETGTYDMAAPPADVPGAWVALAPDKPFGPFFGAIWGTVLGVFGVLGLSAVGFGALVGGIVWWVVRARARRSA
ncbi:hypothetical protein [Cellulomonas dongxiuzhuiae]|uniref:hypothetical protein n=1 Tax=Cellulomonas dongxiuzhuiae TaxID=2819979 RepID=UPI001AAF4039|nr:hypothetical protein [Cellulomonas dongxiuzhuiae]MBO3089371.1 hypothetical protein [Cellulomonas dongxiuzhuiae]